MNNPRILEILDQTRSSLSKWAETARKIGVSNSNIKLINQKLN